MKHTNPRLREEIIDAYDVAIAALYAYESDSDSEISMDVRRTLAEKLERMQQRVIDKP